MEERVVAEHADGEVRAIAGYPGANAAAVRFEGDHLRLAQDYRDAGSEWTFYWNVGVESDVARDLTVEFTRGEVVGPWGPAVSHQRRTWEWLGADAAPDRERFRAALAAGERVHFAFAHPYVSRDFEAFAKSRRAAEDPTRLGELQRYYKTTFLPQPLEREWLRRHDPELEAVSHARNERMADYVVFHADDEETVHLIVGAAHQPGVVYYLERHRDGHRDVSGFELVE